MKPLNERFSSCYKNHNQLLEHKEKVKEFLKKTGVTRSKIRKDTHITAVYQISKTTSIIPYPINNTKYPLIYPPFGIS